MSPEADIVVIIAARDAADTIGAAVASALRESRVAEVLVVDDASRDGTGEAGQAAAGADPRFQVLTLKTNVGPADARNRAIDETRAPFVAVLDADDAFAPDRFANLPATGWDMWADDVAFFRDREAQARIGPPPSVEAQPLKFETFVLGNVADPKRSRGELGFLKPVLSRAFLKRHALRYDANLRLGEDYALYARALALGARFLVSPAPGYAALLRDGSLSAHHRTLDLLALAKADEALMDLPLGKREKRAVARHLAHVMARHAHRECLDIRRTDGSWSALRHAASDTARFRAVVAGVLRDKLLRRPPVPGTLFGRGDGVEAAAPLRTRPQTAERS